MLVPPITVEKFAVAKLPHPPEIVECKAVTTLLNSPPPILEKQEFAHTRLFFPPIIADAKPIAWLQQPPPTKPNSQVEFLNPPEIAPRFEIILLQLE